MQQPTYRNPGPFYHAGGTTGVLLLHGLSGSAYVFEQLAESLAAEGFTAYAPLLAGHGTTPENMEKTNAEDWIASAEAGYDKLAEACDKVFVLGVSFGGLIAASLSLRRPVSGIIMIGTPLAFEHQALIRLAASVLPLLKKRFYEKGSTKAGLRYYEKSGNDLHIGNDIFAGANYSYRKMPYRSVRLLLKYLPGITRSLGDIQTRALVIHSSKDGLITAESGRELVSRLGSKDKELIISQLPHHHLRDLLADPETYGAILGFIRGA